MTLSVNKRPLLRWDLVCSNDGSEYKGVFLIATNTDKRLGGDTLYINKTGSIIGPHLIELFNVRCLPHADGMTIKGKIMVALPTEDTPVAHLGLYDLVERRYFAALVMPKKRKRTKKAIR